MLVSLAMWVQLWIYTEGSVISRTLRYSDVVAPRAASSVRAYCCSRLDIKVRTEIPCLWRLVEES
jgi:hypothetical protein